MTPSTSIAGSFPVAALRRLLYPLLRFLETALDALLFGTASLLRPLQHSTAQQRTLLLARLDAIGDMVMFSGCLPRYRTLFRGWKIVLLITDRTAVLVRSVPWVDEVWVLPRHRYRWNFAERLRWWNRIRGKRFTLTVNCAYSSSARHLDPLVGWSLAPRRVAMMCLDLVDGRLRHGMYHTELVPPGPQWKFETQRNEDLLHYLGWRGDGSCRPSVFLENPDRVTGDKLRAACAPKPLAVVVPGAGAPGRMWPEAKFVQAVRAIDSVDPHCWVLCGNAAEYGLCRRIGEQLRPIKTVNLAGQTTLPELAGIIAGASCVLANETAAVHIAAGTDTPCVCVLGGGFPNRFYPYPGNPRTRAVTHVLDCYHCYWKCTRRAVECVRDVPVESVVRAFLDLRALFPVPGGDHSA